MGSHSEDSRCQYDAGNVRGARRNAAGLIATRGGMMQSQVPAATAAEWEHATLVPLPQFVRLSGILKDYRIIGERLLRIIQK